MREESCFCRQRRRSGSGVKNMGWRLVVRQETHSNPDHIFGSKCRQVVTCGCLGGKPALYETFGRFWKVRIPTWLFQEAVAEYERYCAVSRSIWSSTSEGVHQFLGS